MSPLLPINPLTVQDILTSSGRYPDRPIKYAPSVDVLTNSAELARRLNMVQTSFGRQLTLNSGYRPRAINRSVTGAAANSWHIFGCAADIADPDLSLSKWCLADLKLMEHFGLWLEDPASTPFWQHFQTQPPASGRRVFGPAVSAKVIHI